MQARVFKKFSLLIIFCKQIKLIYLFFKF